MKVLEVFKKRLRNKRYSERTVKTYSCYLYNFIVDVKSTDPYQISTKQIEIFLYNKQFSSISQQNQYIGALKLFAKYILGKSDIHLKKIERPRKEKKLPRVIDKELILEKLSKITNLKHKAILSIAFSVGLRVSEVINLKIEDIDSHRMLITIKNAKGRKDRIVPLSQTILELLRVYFTQHKPKEYLFNGQFQPKYSATSCNMLFKKHIDKKGHFHILRHSSFTSLLEGGTDLRIIQKIAGHSSSKTTEIYTHVSNKLLKNINLAI